MQSDTELIKKRRYPHLLYGMFKARMTAPDSPKKVPSQARDWLRVLEFEETIGDMLSLGAITVTRCRLKECYYTGLLYLCKAS